MISAEWVAALAAIWAAVATTWAVVATFRAPINAAKLTESIQANSERRRSKLWIFGTVMQYRYLLSEVDCVKALNLIDAVFYDVKEVRDAWSNLFATLNDKRTFPESGPLPILEERRTALLAAMAKHLGYLEQFRPDDFHRIYLPTSLSSELRVRDMQRKAVEQSLSGQVNSLPATKK